MARKHLKLAMNIYIFMKFEYYHLIYVRTSRVTFFYWLKFHDTTIYDFGIDVGSTNIDDTSDMSARVPVFLALFDEDNFHLKDYECGNVVKSTAGVTEHWTWVIFQISTKVLVYIYYYNFRAQL